MWAECGVLWKLGEKEGFFSWEVLQFWLLGKIGVTLFSVFLSLVSRSEEGSLWITTVPDTTLKPCKLQRRRMKPKSQR